MDWTADPRIIQPKAFYPGSELFAISVLGEDRGQSGCVVKDNGEISHYAHTSRGSKGGTGGEPHKQEVLVKLKAMLSSLPVSSPTQPAGDRKLVIHSFLQGRTQILGYDRADAPDAVLEFMRLSKCYIPAYTQEVPPKGNWQAHRHDDGSMGFLTKANQIVTCAAYQPLRVWDGKTHALIREVPFPVPHMDAARYLAVSPDERFLALTSSRCMIMDTSSWSVVARIDEVPVGSTTYGYNNPMFLPSGQQLFLRTSAPISGFFDVVTWEAVPPPPALSAQIIKFMPLSSKHQFMTLDRAGGLSFTTSQGAKVTLFKERVQNFYCAEAPDGKQFAVAVGTGNIYARHDYRVLLVDADDGHLIRELRPFEQVFEDGQVVGLFWSPDSRYVLGALESGDIAVWNSATGRHRGTLLGQRPDPNAVQVSPDQTTLYQLRGDGVMQYWDIKSTLDKVSAFEASLEK